MVLEPIYFRSRSTVNSNIFQQDDGLRTIGKAKQGETNLEQLNTHLRDYSAMLAKSHNANFSPRSHSLDHLPLITTITITHCSPCSPITVSNIVDNADATRPRRSQGAVTVHRRYRQTTGGGRSGIIRK